MNDEFETNSIENGTSSAENDVYVRMSKRRAEIGVDNQADQVRVDKPEVMDKPIDIQISEPVVSEQKVDITENASGLSPMDKAIEEFESARDRRAESLRQRTNRSTGYRSDSAGRYNHHVPDDRMPGRGVYSSYRYDSDNMGQPADNTFYNGAYSGALTPDVPPVSNPSQDSKPPKKKKEKGSGSFGRKLLLTVILGIVFGITVGATLYALNEFNIKLPFAINKTIEDDEIEVTDGVDKIKETPTIKGNDDDVIVEDDDPDVYESEVDDSDIDSIVKASADTRVMDVSEVVENVMPSVVSITGDFTIRQRDFWGQVYEQQSSGSGSGIIIGQDEQFLLIATNNHVVEDADKLKVQFIDGAEAEARIKGTDSKIDLAVILVSISDLTTSTKNAISVAVLGDSDSLKVGEPAIAIGNALGYGQSVTTGVISAVNRRLEMSDGTVAEGLIQTDAAINPGNSGGALLNASGEVIGINSSKIGGTTIDGVGFAIPISSAEPILSDIVLSDERVKVASGKEGYLGIGGVTVTEEASQMYGIPVGVVVRQVYEGTGAEQAGILQGDVIVTIGRKSVKSMDALKEELTYYEAGETVSVEIYRNVDGTYESQTVSVELVSEGDLKD